MRGALTLLLATLAAGILAATASAAAVPQGFFGVLADGPLVAQPDVFAAQAPAMRRAGVETVRTVFSWADAEPAGSPATGHPTDFGPTDAIVLAAARSGMTVLPVVQVAPDWAAWEPGPFSGFYRYGSPPADPEDYGRFLQALIGRYGPSGTLWSEHPDVKPVPIRRWQVWNEPMIETYWSRQPWPPFYSALIVVAARMVRAADPGAKIVAAGLPNLGPDGAAWDWANQLYSQVPPDAFDELAVHPFATGAANVLRTLRRVRAVMRAHGDGAKPLLVSEVAYSSRGSVRPRPAGGLGNLDSTRAGQARRIAETLRALAAARRALRLAGVVYATWSSPHANAAFWPDFIGLTHIRGRRVTSKPALRAYTRVTTALEAGR